MRPEWDSIWMSVAKTISQRSIDPRHQVGAIIVTGDNTQLLALGYNGNYKGGPNERESLVSGQSGLIHAEQVVYAEEYRDTTGIDIMRSCGISVRRFDDEEK